MKKLVIAFWSLLLLPIFSFAQEEVFNYGEPKEYELGGVKVTGADYSDDNAIISIAGLRVGDKIRVPGPEIPKAIKALWKLRLFESVEILREKTIGDVIFLEIVVQERPRLTRHSFTGTKKSFHDDLNGDMRHVNACRGRMVGKGAIIGCRQSALDTPRYWLNDTPGVVCWRPLNSTGTIRGDFPCYPGPGTAGRRLLFHLCPLNRGGPG